MSRTPLKWSEGNIIWGDNPYTWGDVALVEEIISGGSGVVDRWKKEDKKKYKKFIKLICKVKGHKEFNEKKEIQDVNITIEDIDLVDETVTKSLKIKR